MGHSAERDTGLAEDGRPGCPVTVWDGPYSTRCGAGASVGKCAYHGTFASPPREVSQYDVEVLADFMAAHVGEHVCSWGCLAIAVLANGWTRLTPPADGADR